AWPGQGAGAAVGGAEGREPDGAAGPGGGARPLDVRGAEGGRLADGRGAAAGLGDLQADGEVARQEPEADRDAVGVQAVADQVVEVVPVDELVDDLLDPPPSAVGARQALRAGRAQAGDVDPRPAPLRRRAPPE